MHFLHLPNTHPTQLGGRENVAGMCVLSQPHSAAELQVKSCHGDVQPLMNSKLGFFKSAFHLVNLKNPKKLPVVT